MPLERLQKIISAAGITSRRKSEQLITGGSVSVNERHIYVVLNKPKGSVTTVADPEGRPTIMDLLRGVGARVYPVGRLDYASEGLLLLTNDGELANALTRAASHVPKTYLVKVSGKPSTEALVRLRSGVTLREKNRPPLKTAPAKIHLLKDAPNPWYEMTLVEGRNRQIRRMFEEIGHHVEKIKRVRYGPLKLDVEPGQFRKLKPGEVARLKSAAPARKPAANPSS